ncbi:hypothetical protein C7379_102173 [Hallella colorans]|uniref:Uncharacterized protein n=1 Tax=Hallella colorans TaxID=1703337 RepID=A0A2U0ULX6_9BACT|nr:hypothetical protein C7379_102173 [Hallella colorans]
MTFNKDFYVGYQKWDIWKHYSVKHRMRKRRMSRTEIMTALVSFFFNVFFDFKYCCLFLITISPYMLPNI